MLFSVHFFLRHKMSKLIKYAITQLFCAIVFVFTTTHADSLKIEVSAKSAILLNAETGAVLYEKNAHQQMHPASITKISTAMYAIEKKGHALEEQIMASTDAAMAVQPHVRRAANSKHPPYRLEFGGSSMGIKIGEVLSLKSLLYGLMLSSGNDAANVIAEHVSGSVGNFVQELNAYIKSKGCEHTIFYCPHGLPHPDHKTTAYDLALLAKEAMKMPLFREIVKTTVYTRPATNLQPQSLMHQHNALVKPGSKFYYPKATGIKTGYTNQAGYTLIGAAEDAQRKLVAVLLGCENLDQRYRDAIAMFEAAFNEEKASRTLFSKEFDVFSTQILGGKTALQATLANDLTVAYYPSEAETLHAAVHWEEKELPIRKEERVGEVRIFSERGQLVASQPLFAMVNVDPTLRYVIKGRWQLTKQTLRAHHSYVLVALGAVFLAGAFVMHGRRKKVKESDKLG